VPPAYQRFKANDFTADCIHLRLKKRFEFTDSETTANLLTHGDLTNCIPTHFIREETANAPTCQFCRVQCDVRAGQGDLSFPRFDGVMKGNAYTCAKITNAIPKNHRFRKHLNKPFCKPQRMLGATMRFYQNDKFITADSCHKLLIWRGVTQYFSAVAQNKITSVVTLTVIDRFEFI